MSIRVGNVSLSLSVSLEAYNCQSCLDNAISFGPSVWLCVGESEMLQHCLMSIAKLAPFLEAKQESVVAVFACDICNGQIPRLYAVPHWIAHTR